MKHLFCESLGIKYEEVQDETEVIGQIVIAQKPEKTLPKQARFADKCVIRLARELGTDLIQVGRSTYRSADGNRGYVITTSKMYTQGSKEKYWFAYCKNPFDDLAKCKEQFVVYGCKDENTLIMLPVVTIDEQLDHLNVSRDEDGNISHWHIVFFRASSGRMTWMLSRPTIQEIDVTEYLI
jgi:hypothetical protein